MKKIKNLAGIKLVLLCAVLLCLVWLGKNAITFGTESFLRATGRMQTVTLSAQDFELIGIKQLESGSFVSTDADPQMVGICGMPLARITLSCSFAVDPGEMMVYYTQSADQAFHPNKRYRFYADGNGSYTATMPLKKVDALRIDPTNLAANTMTIDSITLNAPKSFGQFFAVNAGDIFNLILYSTLISALITLLKEVFAGFGLKKFGKRG